MNIVILQGRLTADPEVRTMESGKTLAEFAIAVRRPRSKDEADFFRCVAWEGVGDFIAEYFGKGDGIAIRGYARQDRWKDGDQNREAIKFIVQDAEFPPGKSQGSGQSASESEEDSNTSSASGNKQTASGALKAAKSSKSESDQSDEAKLMEALGSLPV